MPSGGAPLEGFFPLPFDCDSSGWNQPEDPLCSEYLALVPNGTFLQPELLILLPGLQMEPNKLEHLAHIGAYSGHRTLVVPWNTRELLATRCLGDDSTPTTYLGGQCSTGCNEAVRQEMLTGVDDPITPPEYDHALFDVNGNSLSESLEAGYEAQYLSSIRQRIARGLNGLAEEDTNGDWEWEQYCTPDDTNGTKIQWDSVVIGGFSMGASMAEYIGYTKSTAGVFGAEGHGDYCDVATVTVTPPVASGGQPAPWVAGSPATPDGSWRVALHVGSSQLTSGNMPLDANDWPASFAPLGLLALGESVQDLEDPNGPDPFVWQQEVISTNHNTDTHEKHGAMGSDLHMVGPDEAPRPPGSGTAELVLFDAYLSAMCDL